MTQDKDAYKLLLEQFTEDRKTIKEQYEEIKKIINGSPEKLVVLGDSLVKTSDLLLKQTSQILEFVKISKKTEAKNREAEESLELTEDEKLALSQDLKQ